MLRKLIKKIETIYKYRYLSRHDKGSYDFLLKKIHKSTDIDFLEQVWGLDHFREVLEPKPIDLSELRKVLILAPHQDDEIIGCGGTLIQLAELGTDIHIGFLTNGAELSNPETSVQIRAEEAEVVAGKIGARIRSLAIDNISLDINERTLGELTTWLNEDWDAVFTVWPLDQPPKHRLMSYVVGKAIADSTFDGNVFLYAVHTDLLPNMYSDITQVARTKYDLIANYRSQIAAQRYDHIAEGMDAWRSRFLPVSSKKRYIETFMKIPVEAYEDFQKIYREVNMYELFKENEPCIRSFKQLNRE